MRSTCESLNGLICNMVLSMKHGLCQYLYSINRIARRRGVPSIAQNHVSNTNQFQAQFYYCTKPFACVCLNRLDFKVDITGLYWKITSCENVTNIIILYLYQHNIRKHQKNTVYNFLKMWGGARYCTTKKHR